ncbi:MAG: ABC transporter permease [Nitrospinota bacterium]|nr:MAG: ABC transporter permease [Nitrospinota bacterium]
MMKKGVIRAKLSPYFEPKVHIPQRVYLSTSVLTVSLLFAAWCSVTYTGLVEPIFLPSPTQVIQAGIKMFLAEDLLIDVLASVKVIFTGFILAAILAVPLGMLMGSFKIVEAVIEPITNFIRYLPVSAMIPLLILWVGIGDEEKIAVIFIGTFFQLILLIADVSANVQKELLEISYTLGATRRHVVTRVLIPAALPGIMDNLRITMGWAWTYLVVAELVAADKGLGYVILQSMRGLFTDKIFVGLFVIGFLGLVTDQTFKILHHICLPWSEKEGG